jgi:protein-tyrosine phosphatase
MHPNLNFDQITESIFLGSYLEPGDWHILAALGITANINLMAERRDMFTSSAPEIHLWLPCADLFAPNVHQMRLGAKYIDLLITEGRKLYIHCHSGVGRSPLMVAAYFVYTGMSAKDAFAQVKERRPVSRASKQQVANLVEFAQQWADTRP